MMSYQTVLAIGSGGFLGAVLRAYLNGLISSKFPHDIAFGTLGVNLLGSFIIGVLLVSFMHTQIFSPAAKSFLTTGLLGGLTTFSTFAIESFLLLSGGQLAMAAANIILNVVGSVMMAGGGFYLTKIVFKA